MNIGFEDDHPSIDVARFIRWLLNKTEIPIKVVQDKAPAVSQNSGMGHDKATWLGASDQVQVLIWRIR